MPKVGFVSDVQISTSETGINVKCSPSNRGETPTQYVIRVFDRATKSVIEKRVVDLDKSTIEQVEKHGVDFGGLTSGQQVRVGVRQKVGSVRGRMVNYIVTVGEVEFPPLLARHYMYQVPAGEPTPEDAVGEPTRHVSLLDGVWRRYNPKTRWVANEMYLYYERLEEAEKKLAVAEAVLSSFNANNPGSPDPRPQWAVDRAREEVAAQQSVNDKVLAEKMKAADVRYPPENLTQDQVRWVERPKQR